MCLDRTVVAMKKHEKHKKHQKHEAHRALVRGAASIYEQSIIWGGSVGAYSEGADVVFCSGIYQKVEGVTLHPNLFANSQTLNYGIRPPLIIIFKI